MMWKVLIFCMVLLINSSSSSVIRNNATSEGLYTNKDNVLILTSENFKSELYGRNRSILVEFYNTWCGFCQKYAPVWKVFAKEIKPWQDVIAISVMDCANELNAATCTEFEITRYPNLRYFHPYYEERNNSYGLQVQLSNDVTEEIDNIAKLLRQEQSESRGAIFPNLQPYVHPNSANLFDFMPDSVKYVILVIHNATENVGMELTMDFHRVKELAVRYAYINNTDLLKQLAVPSDNFLLLFQRGKHDPEILSSSSLDRVLYHNAVTRALLERNITFDEDEQDHSDNEGSRQNNSTNAMNNDDDAVFQVDLENALRYSLKREIGGLKELANKELEATQKYINVLVEYFPFGDKGKALLTAIKEYVDDNNATKNLTGKTIRQMIIDADQPGDGKVFSSPAEWRRCKGSAAQYRGYPCGMWTLFHYLTVNADQDNFRNEVLDAMYNYIKYLFGCRACSEHFVTRAHDKKLFEVKTQDEAILWLWRVHNDVNRDLAGDTTEDPQHPKIQFPSKRNCPQCYNADESWNNDAVLDYLKTVYGRRNLNYAGSDVKYLGIVRAAAASADLIYTSNKISTSVLLPTALMMIWKYL